MTWAEVEVILQVAGEKYMKARLRINSDNGPRFIAGYLNKFIRNASKANHSVQRRGRAPPGCC